MPKNFLEPDFTEGFDLWKRNPDPRNTSKMLTHLNPAIDKGIRIHLGSRPDPLIRSRARKLTLQAMKSYDPTQGARLETHVINQLQGLKRIARHQAQILSIPEQVSLDQGRITNTQAVLYDELGRDPSDAELSDRMGLSLKRLQHVRTFKPAIAEGTFSRQSGQDDDFAGSLPAVDQQSSQAWLSLIYGDLDPVNQKILEWSAGLHGSPIYSNQEIARRLKITPGAVTQRKAGIQQKLDMESQLSPF